MATAPINPWTLELQQLQRRRAIADMLQQQAMTPLQGQIAGPSDYPVFVKPTALQGIAKFGDALGSMYLNRKSDEQYANIASAMMEAQRQAISGLSGAPSGATPAMPAPAVNPPSTPADENAPPPLIRDPNYQPPQPQAGAPMAPPPAASVPTSTPSLDDILQSSQNALTLGVDPEVVKIAAAARTPTPEMREIAAVYGENSPQYRTALERKVNPAIATQPNAPLARFNPATAQYETAYAAPNLERGINPIVQNGQIVGEAPLPGAANVAATMAAAQEAGTQSQKPTWQPGPSGQPTPVFVTPPMMTGAGPMGAIGRGNLPPAASATPPLQTTAGKSSQEALGKNAGDYAQALADRSAAAVDGKRTLSEMGSLLQGFQPGAGAPLLTKMGSVAQALGVSPDTVQQWTNINPGDAEAFQKGTAALATEAAKQVSNRVTQMEFKTFLANNPNWMMTPNGIKRVMDFMGKGFDSQIEQQRDFAQWSKTHPAETWTTDFPAYWNQKQTARISRGETNSTPSSLSSTETSTDIRKAPGTPQRVSSKADFDKLPHNSLFMGDDGITYRKP